jgi:hypothetical protein
MQITQLPTYMPQAIRGRTTPIPRSAARDRISAQALGLSDRAIIMTIPALKPVRASGNPNKRPQWDEDLSDANATLADLEAATTVQKAIAHGVMEALYGRHWAKQADHHHFVWFAGPEAISKDGYEATQLHWHVTFDTDQLDVLGEQAIFSIIENQADKIHMRLCNFAPPLYLNISESSERHLAYSQKFHGVGTELFNSAVIVSSRAERSVL